MLLTGDSWLIVIRDFIAKALYHCEIIMADDNVLFAVIHSHAGRLRQSCHSQRDSESSSDFPERESRHNWIFGYETGIIQLGIVLKSLI